MTGNDTITAFAAGKAAMAIGGDFSHAAVEAGKVKGRYAVVPLPGVEAGSIAPAFAGGNNLGVLKSTSHRTLAVDLMQRLASKEAQGELFDAMGFLPTFSDVRQQVAAKEAFVKPFVETLAADTKFVPASPAWAQIDAGAGTADDVPGDRVRQEGRQVRLGGRREEDERRVRVRRMTVPTGPGVLERSRVRVGGGFPRPRGGSRRSGTAPRPRTGRSRTPWLYLAPALVVLGGCSPIRSISSG